MRILTTIATIWTNALRRESCASERTRTTPITGATQNAAFFVHDQFGQNIRDYFIEFYDDNTSFLEELFHRKILQDVHAYSDNGAYRAMLMDIKTLREEFPDSPSQTLKISLSAQPDFQNPNHNAGYATFDDKDVGAISLDAVQVQQLFRPNETVLVEIILRRQQRPEVFQFV